MSLGDSGRSNGNSNKKIFENTYYSRMKFKDPATKLSLGLQYKSGMMVVDVSKEVDGFNYEQVANIYITVTKANILLQEINRFKNDLKDGKVKSNVGYGITAGMDEIVSILLVHRSKDENGYAITIGKVDGSGKFQSSVDFEFAKQYNYGIHLNNISTMDAEKDYFDDVEFNMFTSAVEQFATAMSGAYSYSVVDMARYDTRSIINKMNPIYDKLGIERPTSGAPRTFQKSSNYFDHSNSGDQSSQHKSYDEAMEDLGLENDGE